MRITSGKLKNKLLSTNIPETTRPTTEALRQSVFSALASQTMIEHSTFLDLFAGTGAIGLEAYSRGASKVTFVDNQKLALQCLKENIELLEIPKTSMQAFYGDALDILQSGIFSDTFSIVYIDPPYKTFLIGKIFQLLVDKNLLKFDSIVVTELQNGMKVPSEVLEIFSLVNSLQTPQATVQFWKLL